MGERGFDGFGADGLAFLAELAAIQEKGWFEANKARYEAHLRGPMIALVAELGEALSRQGMPLAGDPRRSVFRIHRDVRFSKDKRPYKTHIGATLTRDGGKLSPGLVYIHIEPGRSFAAAGFYHPEPDALTALRRHIADRPDAFGAVLDLLKAAGLALSPDTDALKRLPRGFEGVSDEVLVEALRRRSFTVHRPLDEATVLTQGLVGEIARFARDAEPLLEFGWAALDETGGP